VPVTPAVTVLPWKTATPITYKAPDHTGYRAVIKPSGVYVPRGWDVASSVFTVKDSQGRTLASNAKYYTVKPGVYTIYSSVTYRRVFKTITYPTVSGEVTGLEPIGPCDLLTTTPQTGSTLYTFQCWGTGNDIDGISRELHFNIELTVTDGGPVFSGRASIDASNPLWADVVIPPSATANWTTTVVTYRYADETVGRAKRKVTIVRNNTPYVTKAQYQALRKGMTIKQVGATLGQSGFYQTAVSVYREYHAYNCFDKNGKYNGYQQSASNSVACAYLRTFRFVYKSGALYAWDYIDDDRRTA